MVLIPAGLQVAHGQQSLVYGTCTFQKSVSLLSRGLSLLLRLRNKLLNKNEGLLLTQNTQFTSVYKPLKTKQSQVTSYKQKGWVFENKIISRNISLENENSSITKVWRHVNINWVYVNMLLSLNSNLHSARMIRLNNHYSLQHILYSCSAPEHIANYLHGYLF